MMWVWEVHVISSSWMTAYCCRCCRLGGCYCYWRSWQWRCSCPHCKRLGVGIWRFTCHGSVVSMEMRGFPSCKSQSILAREVGQSHLTSYDELGDTSGKKRNFVGPEVRHKLPRFFGKGNKQEFIFGTGEYCSHHFIHYLVLPIFMFFTILP
jgi:hypothetical protein